MNDSIATVLLAQITKIATEMQMIRVELEKLVAAQQAKH